VWVTNRLDDTVTEINPVTGKPRRTLPTGPSPSDIGYGLGALWITNETAASVTRLNPDTGALEEIAVGNGPEAVTVADGAVWVANSLNGTVSRIDPSQNVVSSAVTVGAGPSSLVATDGSIWVADSYSGRVDRIDTATNRVVSTVSVGSGPQSLTAFGDRVWLTARQTSATHRGGTLRLYDLVSPDSFDQSFSYGGWAAIVNTSDGLVGFRRVGGLDGSTIVPDLATSIPLPTDSGRTYVFHLQPNIQYSNGETVRASDFRRGLERAYRTGNVYLPFYYTGIVGTDRCSRSHCDLSRGIVADDRAGTVTYHLRAADADFLDKLALPAAFPVPPGAPMTKAQRLGVPGTGPYQVQSWADNHLVLVRNPHFRVWSAEAQPAGYPDRIEWTYIDTEGLSDAQVTKAIGAQLTAVEQGKADLMVGPPPSRHEIETRYAAQLHSLPFAGVYGIFLNTEVPPFNNLLARQAVNFAIDRSKSISGNFGGTITCQALPPGMPGYQPYCPYTRHPTAGGIWSGPDLARARKLVAASGTSGARVIVWTHEKPVAAVIGKLAVATLRKLGYRATLKILPHDAYWAHVNSRSSHAQVGFMGWSQDYPAPSGFLNELTCAARGESPGGSNVAELCDPHFDRAVAQALIDQATDSPQAANRGWAAVDRMVTDLSPWAVLYNPHNLVFVSKRVGNLQSNPQWGVLADQIWVR
jgi:YVTN family beta-propeller protein